MTKPEALRLADHIEDGYYGHCFQAAAELRRQHELLREARDYVECVPDDRRNAEHIDRVALIARLDAALGGQA